MLPADILKHILTYCNNDFFDTILTNNDTKLINYLSKLGLKMELYLSELIIEPYYTSPREYIRKKNIKIYVKRYFFLSGFNDLLTILDPRVTQIVPYGDYSYEFDCIIPGSTIVKVNHTNSQLLYKSEYESIFAYKRDDFAHDIVNGQVFGEVIKCNDVEQRICKKTLKCDIINSLDVNKSRLLKILLQWFGTNEKLDDFLTTIATNMFCKKNKTIIAITGEPCTGKSSFCELLIKAMGGYKTCTKIYPNYSIFGLYKPNIKLLIMMEDGNEFTKRYLHERHKDAEVLGFIPIYVGYPQSSHLNNCNIKMWKFEKIFTRDCRSLNMSKDIDELAEIFCDMIYSYKR